MAVAKAFDIDIPGSGAGRLGFYIDYSELSGTGTHTFYVIRTHGTEGAVTVDYDTYGDTHTNASGTLSWSDGDCSIQSFTAVVSTKSANGLHTIYAELTNATGGAVCHHGDGNTRAYGIIDDGTVPSDSDAVFYDSAAGAGSGTAADPYGSIYTAIANVGSKKYLCGKGTTTPDGTDSGGPYGTNSKVIDAPPGRASETARLFIMAWPGFTWTIDGNTDTQTFGFCNGNPSVDTDYHTYRGIAFNDLDSTGDSAAPIAGIWYHYGTNGSDHLHVEYCTFTDMNGGENNYGVGLYRCQWPKVWRCTFSNIQKNGAITNQNTSGVGGYEEQYASVQRCEMDLCYNGVNPKKVRYNNDVGYTIRFCKIGLGRTDVDNGVILGARMIVQGSSNPSHAYTIVQANLMRDCTWTGHGVGAGINHAATAYNPDYPGGYHWWCNNVFDNCGVSLPGAIDLVQAYNCMIFNNIFLDCSRLWTDQKVIQYEYNWPTILYADYNHAYGTYNVSGPYELIGVNYASAAALCTATS